MRTPHIPQNENSDGEQSLLATLPEIMTVDELAALLRLNRKTVYDAAARGEIPGLLRVGRVIRFSRMVVLGWLQGQGRDSHSSSRRRP